MLSELLAIERAVGPEDVGAELLDDRRERRRAGLDHPSSELVGVEVHRPVLDESSARQWTFQRRFRPSDR